MLLSVASWNVLATSYVRPDLYGACDPAAIEPTARRSRVVELAAGLDADVVCLQEVEQDQFDALVKRFSDTHECSFGRKGGDKPDGCAIFAKQSRRFARSGGLQRYADGSGHMFSWVFAELGGRPVGIATTHLKWDPPRTPAAARHGLLQAEELVMALPAIASDAPWIVCGDFNAESQDEVLERFRLAGFRDPHEHAGPTCSANGRCRRIDFLLYGPGLVGAALPGAALSDGALLPSLEMPSDHVPIRASFDPVSEASTIETNGR